MEWAKGGEVDGEIMIAKKSVNYFLSPVDQAYQVTQAFKLYILTPPFLLRIFKEISLGFTAPIFYTKWNTWTPPACPVSPKYFDNTTWDEADFAIYLDHEIAEEDIQEEQQNTCSFVEDITK
jgi:hypothetical protein